VEVVVVPAIVGGAALYLFGRAAEDRSGGRLTRAAFAIMGAGVVALSGISFALAMSSDGGLVGGHQHGQAGSADALAKTADPSHVSAHASGLPGVVHDHGTGIDVTVDQLAAAEQLVSATKAGTAPFADLKVAEAAGYRQITPFTAGLAHFHNQAYYSSDQILDPAHPAELIYFRSRTGAITLVGAMFLAQPGQAGPRIGGALTAWHAHDNLCWSNTTGMVVALTDANGRCPSGTSFHGATPEMLHVWLVDNPDGVFAENMAPTTIAALLTGKATK